MQKAAGLKIVEHKASAPILALIAALSLSQSVLAQAPSSEPAAPPSASPPAGTATGTMAPSAPPNSSVVPNAPGSMSAPAPAGTAATTTNSAGGSTAAANATFLSQPSANQLMASQYIGKAVYGANNERVGDINDIVIDAAGNPAALVIGVGGFLGIGEKNVAVPFSAVRLNTQDGKETLTMAIMKRDLEQAPSFKTDGKRS